MHHTHFLERQKSRIKKRIQATEKLIRAGRIDARFKAERILDAQRRALIRIHIGLYGRCGTCGTKIPKARLEAVPAAIRCLPCQERAEH